MWRNAKGNRRGWRFRGSNKMVFKGENHGSWKGDEVQDETKRKRARSWFATPPECQKCGEKKKIERYHKDSNPGNNSIENIAFLCRRCHMDADGRLELFSKFPQLNAPLLIKDPQPCIICHVPSKPLRRGRCHACNEYYRRNGHDRKKSTHDLKHQSQKCSICGKCGHKKQTCAHHADMERLVEELGIFV